MKRLAATIFLAAILMVAVIADAAPRIKYSGIATDRYGNVIESATISVYLAGTTTPAKCYTTETSSTAVYSVTSASDGVYFFWVDAADYGYVQRYKTVTSKTGFTSKTNDDIFTAYFPANSAGYLKNDGAGALSWDSISGSGTLPADSSGWLQNDGAGTLSWSTPPGSGDMTKAVYDVADNGKIDAAAIDDLAASIITSGTFDVARIPDLSATYDIAGSGASAVATHEGTYNHTNFLTSVAETNFNFTDITTGDASTTKHGLLPKIPGGSGYLLGQTGWTLLSLTNATYFRGQGYNASDNYFLSGAATPLAAPSWVRLEDTKIYMTASSTTNDATATTHGFLPILSGSDADCLLGDGTWDTCPGGSVDWTVPGTIGSGTPNTGDFTDLTADTITVNRTDAPSIYRSYEATSDGNNYKDIIAPAKGTGFAGNRTHTQGDYDSSDVLNTTVASSGYVQNTRPLEVDGHAAISLTALQVSGTTIYNTGQTVDVYLALPTAAAGYQALFTAGTTVAKYWGVQADTNDKIYLIAADGTVTAGADNGYVRMNAAQIGQSFACWTFKTDAYDWMCKAISIGTSTFAVP